VALAAAGQLLFSLHLLARTWPEGVLVLGVGEWSARAGIIVAVDPLSALMVTLAAGTVLLAILYGFAESPLRNEHPLRLPLLQFLLMGINLSFITGDLFNLFVGFEVMLISSYALLTLEADDWEVKQAYPYLALNLIGSTLFICAAGLLYALAGTLNYAVLHERLAGLSTDPRLTVLAFMLISVFTLKAGLFPLYFWLPNSYPILATPLAAVYAGLLTKVGLYVLLRVLGTVLPHDLTTLHQALGVMAICTLVAGGLGSVARGFVRGLLSFQVVSAVGVMAVALGWFTPLGVTACVFYLMQDVVVKAGLFFAGGVATLVCGSDHLKQMGGLWKKTPLFGVAFPRPGHVPGRPPALQRILGQAGRLAGRRGTTGLLRGGGHSLHQRAHPGRLAAHLAFRLLAAGTGIHYAAPRRAGPPRHGRPHRSHGGARPAHGPGRGTGVPLGPAGRRWRAGCRWVCHGGPGLRGQRGGALTMVAFALNMIMASLWLLLSNDPGRAVLHPGLHHRLPDYRGLPRTHPRRRHLHPAHPRDRPLRPLFPVAVPGRQLQRGHGGAAAPARRLHPGFVDLDVSALRPPEILLLTYCITLTPGTVSIRISDDYRTLVVHALDAADAVTIQRDVDRQLIQPILAFTR
jgi:NADH:ubiquinone oxidoreductase subunit 2 (subunit N)